LPALLAVAALLAACGPEAVGGRQDQAVAGEVALKVYLVRHAESYKNVFTLPGTPPEKLDSLTPKGREQAARAGGFLRDKGLAAVIASPTGRTRQTAQALVQAAGAQAVYAQNPAFASLREGRTPSGARSSWSWRQTQWAAGRDPRPQGGESLPMARPGPWPP